MEICADKYFCTLLLSIYPCVSSLQSDQAYLIRRIKVKGNDRNFYKIKIDQKKTRTWEKSANSVTIFSHSVKGQFSLDQFKPYENSGHTPNSPTVELN